MNDEIDERYIDMIGRHKKYQRINVTSPHYFSGGKGIYFNIISCYLMGK